MASIELRYTQFTRRNLEDDQLGILANRLFSRLLHFEALQNQGLEVVDLREIGPASVGTVDLEIRVLFTTGEWGVPDYQVRDVILEVERLVQDEMSKITWLDRRWTYAVCPWPTNAKYKVFKLQ